LVYARLPGGTPIHAVIAIDEANDRIFVVTVYIPGIYQRVTGGKMIGEHAKHSRCPVCGGNLEAGEATIPYILKDGTVVVVKNVPAEICGDCREPFTSGKVTDHLVMLSCSWSNSKNYTVKSLSSPIENTRWPE
jgi:YgiT-type zinc finger domain-containing protein